MNSMWVCLKSMQNRNTPPPYLGITYRMKYELLCIHRKDCKVKSMQGISLFNKMFYRNTVLISQIHTDEHLLHHIHNNECILSVILVLLQSQEDRSSAA